MAYRAAGRLSGHTLSPVFWVLAALYGCHRLLAWLSVPRPDWVRHYLDDLLCLPLVLTATLFLLRCFFGPSARLTGYHVLFAVGYVSLAFEVFFPSFLPRYTADVFDVALYALGGLFFYRFLNT